MGNHEQRLLAARHARQRGEPGPKLGASHAEVAVQLNDDDWAVLESFPLWIDVARSTAMRVVHAGVVPGVPFEAQDPWLLTAHSLLITEDGKPSEKWGTLWGCLYTELPATSCVRTQRASASPDSSRSDGARHGVRLRRRIDCAGARRGRAAAARR